MVLHLSETNRTPLGLVILAGADTVLPTLVNDTTFTFLLPLGPSDPVVIRVPGAAGGDSVGTVERVGYASSRALDEVYWALTTWRPGAGFAVLGYTLSGTTVSADFETGAVTVYPGLAPPGDDYVYGTMGATNLADTYVLRDSATRELGVWRLFPTLLRVADGPTASAFSRQLDRVSDSIWVGTGHHSYTVTRSGDSTGRNSQLEGATSVINSPDGHYTTFVAYSHTLGMHGVPVLESHTGDSLYVLPAQVVWAATFAADSRTLFLVGGDGSQSVQDTVIVADPANGAELRRVVLPDSAVVFGMSHEAASGRLYLAAQNGSDLEVLVYDAMTLELLGRLPGGPVCILMCGGGDLVADPVGLRLFVVGSGSQVTVQTFDLLP